MTRVLAVADTDSWLTWSSATLAPMPPDWHRTQLVIENPVMPSAAGGRGPDHRPLYRAPDRPWIWQLHPHAASLAVVSLLRVHSGVRSRPH